MTGGQAALSLDDVDRGPAVAGGDMPRRTRNKDIHLVVRPASEAEIAAHEAMLDAMQAAGPCVFRGT